MPTSLPLKNLKYTRGALESLLIDLSDNETSLKTEVSYLVTFNAQVKFCFGTTSGFVIVFIFGCKIGLLLDENCENLISAQPRISAHLE